MALANRIALVTGSTSGIGLGIARTLAKAGANIILNGFGKPSEIDDLKRKIHSEFKVKVDFSGADLSSCEQIEEMMKSFGDRGIDILVNNAGVQHVCKVEEFTAEQFNKVININLGAVFHTTRLAIPGMKARNWGRIINVASVHGLVASVNKSAYVASKHGVIGLTKATALELARTKVTCNAICPGWVLTPLVQRQIDLKAEKLNLTNDQARDALLLEKQPSGEFVTPEQLGELALFLSSDSASEVRGVAWAMDGGWTAQ